MGSKKFPHVFAPIRIRGIDFKNRIVLAPPSPNLAGTNGLVTPELVDWMRMFARGGVTTLYLGNSSIDISESKDEAFQLNLCAHNEVERDAIVLNLARYADMCKQYQCHASLEINHNGENTAFETVGHAPYSASARVSATEEARAARLGREPIPSIEMTKEKIDETVRKFGDAAAMMQRAGMDICLVHGGHGNLISQFTSPLYNQRTDEYGGSTANRARFAIEVCDEIRRQCGEKFVIEFRISADEIHETGMHFEETLELIGLLKDHIDILHVSAGLHSDFQMKYFRNWCQNYMMERGFNVHYARKVKEAYPDLLVTTVGSITNIEMAEEIIGNGWADFVAMCRPLMADPDMPNKYSQDKPEEHRPCLRCDTCMKHLMIPKPIYCAINPMSGMTSEIRDGVVPFAKEKKRVAVVGGGPGGIQALQTLCERGHDVTLYEMSDRLGGNAIGAAIPPFKIDCQDYLTYIRYKANQCVEKYGAKIFLNTKATKELLEAKCFDAVIIAIGSDPIIPRVPGVDKPHVQWAPHAEEAYQGGDKSAVGDNIVIVGSGAVGLEAAIEFAQDGKKCTIVDMVDEQSCFMKLSGSSSSDFRRLIDELNVDKSFGCKLTEICDDHIVVEELATGELKEIKADTVLLAVGIRPRWNEADELRHSAPEEFVRIVGDARQVGTISEAVNQAFQACIHI